MVSLRLYNRHYDCPTNAALLLVGKDPRRFMPGAYVQYVSWGGLDNASQIQPAHLRGEPMYVAAAAGHLHRHGDCSKETHACVCSPRGGHLQLSHMGNPGASDECHHAPRLQWQCASEILPVSRPY